MAGTVPSALARLAWASALLLAAVSPLAVAGDRMSSLSSAVVTIKATDQSLFGSSAADEGWGAPLPSQTVPGDGPRAFFPLVYTTASLTDRFGCTSPAALKNASTASNAAFAAPAAPFVLLVDRGRCTYTEKALFAQQHGATALIVTDTVEQAYNRSRVDAGATPEQREMEFSCRNGQGEAPAGVDLAAFARADGGWAAAVNAPQCAGSAACDSDMCIPAGGARRQVCCVWDVPDAMGFSASTLVPEPDTITIPVVRVRIADGRLLKRLLEEARNATASNADAGADASAVLVTVYERDPPIMDPSQFIIWLLAIVTVMIGGYKGAAVERSRALRKQSAAMLATTTATTGAATGANGGSEYSPRSAYTHGRGAAPSLMNESVITATTLQDPATAGPAGGLDGDDDLDGDHDTMELTIYHAFGFVFFATAFLLVLFYWNIVIVVIVGFALGAISSGFYVLWQPLFARLYFLRRFKPFEKSPPTGWFARLEPETWSAADMFALVWSVAVALLWFINRHRKYAWMLQDLFGVCLCILFLRTIRLPNLRIATFMLALVFLYDIFMVFISPFIFNESVMIKAATGGSQAAPTVGDGYCMRYPTDTAHNCLREQMPILLRLPKVIDWRDGQSMLGLGDIVLPGLLIVFCARFDYATRGQLMGRVKPHLARLKSSHQLEAGGDPGTSAGTSAGDQPTAELSSQGNTTAPRRGLFGIMMWGYAIGLLLANVGVTVMKQGQPALMYLVPSTLGTLMFVAWRRGILRKLWIGPEEFDAFYLARGSRFVARDRDRNHTMDHAIREEDDAGMVVLADGTPLSTYSRPDDTPKHRGSGSSSSGGGSPQR